MTADNRQIYDTKYTPAGLRLRASNAYERQMMALRFSLIEQFGSDRDVLDVGCGPGAYLLPCLPKLRSAIALDSSATMLGALRASVPPDLSPRVRLIQSDAAALPLADACVDFAYSYSTLYYVPDASAAIASLARVLRPGGVVVLDLGAQWSLNTLVSWVNHHASGWARPQHLRVAAMRTAIERAGLTVKEWRSFQLLPMYGAPRWLAPLWPLLTAYWKRPLGVMAGGRMLDERFSSLPGLRRVAFRQLVVAVK